MSSTGHDDAERGGNVLRFPERQPVVGLHQQTVTSGPDDDLRLRHVIGEVLRDERLRQKRTLVDVAEEAAVSVPYLSEVERGRKEVSSDLLQAIHEALGLNLRDVLERSTERFSPQARASLGPTMLAA